MHIVYRKEFLYIDTKHLHKSHNYKAGPTRRNSFMAIYLSKRFLRTSVGTNLINSLSLFPMTTKRQWELFDAREAEPVDEER